MCRCSWDLVAVCVSFVLGRRGSTFCEEIHRYIDIDMDIDIDINIVWSHFVLRAQSHRKVWKFGIQFQWGGVVRRGDPRTLVRNMS